MKKLLPLEKQIIIKDLIVYGASRYNLDYELTCPYAIDANGKVYSREQLAKKYRLQIIFKESMIIFTQK